MVNVSLRNAGLSEQRLNPVLIIPAIQMRLRRTLNFLPTMSAVNRHSHPFPNEMRTRVYGCEFSTPVHMRPG